LFVFFAILIFANGSRFAIFGAVFICIIFSLLVKQSYRSIAIFSILLLTPLFILPFITKYYLSEFNIDFNYLFHNIGYYVPEGNFGGRLAGIWLPAINHIEQNSFWIGFGVKSWFDQVITVHSQYYGGVYQFYRAPHNAFIFNFYQFGTIGVSLYITLFYMGFKNSIYAYKNTRSNYIKHISAILICSLIGFFIWNSFANAWPRASFPIFVMLLGFTIKIYCYVLKENNPPCGRLVAK
jgi:hypothetical protein